MKEVLLPVDGSERSLHSLEAVKRIYPPDQAALTILMVAPGVESERNGFWGCWNSTPWKWRGMR